VAAPIPHPIEPNPGAATEQAVVPDQGPEGAV
jgi:hypothetical protein